MSSHRVSDKDFSRDLKIPFKDLFFIILGLSRSSLQTEIDRFYKQISEFKKQTLSLSKSAFSQTRSKFSPNGLSLQFVWRKSCAFAVYVPKYHLSLQICVIHFLIPKNIYTVVQKTIQVGYTIVFRISEN
jgi:hypothetical protein